MFEKERSGIDRCSGADSRRVMNFDYWLSEGVGQKNQQRHHDDTSWKAEA